MFLESKNVTVNLDLPDLIIDEPEQAVDGGGLAAAIRTQKPEDLPVAPFEGQIVQSADAL